MKVKGKEIKKGQFLRVVLEITPDTPGYYYFFEVEGLDKRRTDVGLIKVYLKGLDGPMSIFDDDDVHIKDENEIAKT